MIPSLQAVEESRESVCQGLKEFDSCGFRAKIKSGQKAGGGEGRAFCG